MNLVLPCIKFGTPTLHLFEPLFTQWNSLLSTLCFQVFLLSHISLIVLHFWLKMRLWFCNSSCLVIHKLVYVFVSISSFCCKLTLMLCCQMILSFELPFALIPLLKFTSSKTKMGEHANSTPVRFCMSGNICCKTLTHLIKHKVVDIWFVS